MPSNLGAVSLRRRPRNHDPMRAYDDLPPPLRRWLSQAVLPWSPASCRRIWRNASRAGLTAEQIIARLDRAESRTLARADGLNRHVVAATRMTGANLAFAEV